MPTQGDVIALARPIVTERGNTINRNHEGVVMEVFDRLGEKAYRVRFMLASAGHTTVDVVCFPRDFQDA